MDVEIKVSTLSDKDKAVAKALGYLADASSEATGAEIALNQGPHGYFEDEISAIHSAAATMKFVWASILHRVMDIAVANGAARGDYVRFVDDEGETVSFVYVR